MDYGEIFQKLAFGIKFDFQRFQKEAELFQLIRPSKVKEETDEKEKENIIKSEPMEEDSEIESKQVSNVKSVKRKHEEDEDNDESKQKNIILLGEITAAEDGTVIKTKKKQKVLTEDKVLKLEREKINQHRNKHHITVKGVDIPSPIESFQQLSTDYKVENDILQNMTICGYNEPTPIQMQAIPAMLEKKHLLACAPTGSGKTAAFLLPIIHHLNGPQKKGFRAVVLTPTRELAKQTHRECVRLSEGRGYRIHIISKINQALTKYGPKSSQKFDILITTPKRLIYLLNQEPPAISLQNVEWLVIDEADRMFESGSKGFKQQLDEISKACVNPDLRYGLFSATNTHEVTKWCAKNIKPFITVMIGRRNAAAETIDQELIFVGNEQGKLLEIRNIIQKGVLPPVLIFVQSKERAQELFKELIYDGVNIDVIHADRTQTQRDNAVRCFREGKTWILVCTELMSRGIDFVGVNLVINFDFPQTAHSYIHRIGRTGRAGHKGKAITFFTQEDIKYLRSIASVMRESGCDVPEYMFSMKRLTNKKKRRKMEKTVPERESISTIPKFKNHTNNKTKQNQKGDEKSQTPKDKQKKLSPKNKPDDKKKNKSKKIHKVVSTKVHKNVDDSGASNSKSKEKNLRLRAGRKKKTLVKNLLKQRNFKKT